MLDLTFSLTELEFFLLIVVRITCFFFSAPFFSTQGVPRQVKIGCGVLTAVLIYRIIPMNAVEYSTVMGYAIVVIKEALTGLIIGYGANICSMIISYAGHLMDMEIGLSMVSLMDPLTKEGATISGVLYQNTFLLMLFISGLYQFILLALRESFTLIPINGAVFSSERLLSSIITFLGDYLILGFRISLPVFCALLLMSCILGILAKVSPQLNMFAVGIQLKILLGLAVMFLTVGLLPEASDIIYDETRKIVTLFVEALL